MTATAERPRPARPGLTGPMILIIIGGVLLLNNLDLLSWGIWDALFRLWPLLLIALGLDLIVGRRSPAAALIVPLLTLVAFALAIWWAAGQPAAGALDTTRIDQPLRGAARAEVELGVGFGELRLAALPEPSALIAGSVQASRSARLTPSFELRDGVAFYSLRSEGGATAPPWGGRTRNERWELALSPAVPLRLTLATGVGSTSADLSRLQVTDLRVNVGVGQVDVTLPGQGQLQARFNGGVGETIVRLPPGLAARIEVDRGLGAVEVQGDFTRSGDRYESPGYAQAANRVDLKINGGIGAITVRTAGE